MKLQDRSHYFKGLLLLIKKDNKITEEERQLLMQVGELLQFNHEFCETTIEHLLENKHVDEFELKFSNRKWAKIFLKDGLRIAFADESLHINEYKWLEHVTRTNNIPVHWLFFQLSKMMNNKELANTQSLEIRKHYEQIQTANVKPAVPA